MIIAIGSWRGLGATTTALLVASHLADGEPDGAWLIEADPAGGVLAARMQLAPEAIGGLERVAFPTERSTPAEAFASVAHQAGNLRVVTAPADPFRAFACHQPRMPWSSTLRELSGNVVVDVGRLRAGSPVWAVLGVADHVLLVSAPEVSAAVTTAEWLRGSGRVSHNDPGLAGTRASAVFVESPGGISFTQSALRADMGVDVAGWLPWEPSAVDLIHRGAVARDRRLRRSNLFAAVGQLADGLFAAGAGPMTDEELDQLVVDLRRQWGDRLPVPTRDESAAERDLREEMTRDVLDRVILPELEQQRLVARLAPLDDHEQSAVVDLVISEIFGLPRLLTVLRDPQVTDVLVFGADHVRVERSDGTTQLLPPLVRRDRDLERIIYDTATLRRRPFNRESPFVDLELEPGVRFHGEGFDVVQRPLVTIRRAAVFGMTLVDLSERGMLDAGAVALLQAAIRADMNVVVCGRMGSGKTTVLRALVAEVDTNDVIVTVETDFELNLAKMGRHRYVHAYQSRVPSTSDGVGISCHDMMVPAVRTRADWMVVGEVRGAEGGALVQAMSIGQGAMATVHGGSAKDGVERLAELIAYHNGVELRMARWQVYRSVDLVVHVTGNNQIGRYVTEIAAPSVEEDGARFIMHRLFGAQPEAADRRARPASEPQRTMLERLAGATPEFSTHWWHTGADTHVPLHSGVSSLRRVG